MKMPDYVSASQVKMHRTCNRKWWLRYVKGIKKPQTAAQKRGSVIHKHIENYLNEKKLPEEDLYHPYLKAAITAHDRDGALILPDPELDENRYLVEHKFTIPTAKGLPPWLGYIDVLRTMPAVIGDFKTTSNLRYAKTPTELRTDPQMVSYAKFAFNEDPIDELLLWHLYIETRSVKGVLTPPKTKLPRTKYVPLTVTPEEIDDQWQEEIEEVAEMVKTAAKLSQHDVTPTTTACGDYGGCEYQQECGLGDMPLSFSGKKQKAKKEFVAMSNVLDRLNKKIAAKGGKPVAKPAAKPAAKTTTESGKAKMPAFLAKKLDAAKASKGVPTGVVPPDAPERTTPVVSEEDVEAAEAATAATEEVIAAEEKPTKKKRKPRADKGKSRKKKADTIEAAGEGPTVGYVPATEGFEIYVDCMLIKATDINGTKPVMFEDWAAPIIQQINETVAAEKGCQSYLQLDYSSEKAALTMAFAAAVGTVPPVLVISSSTLGAKEALNVLVPHARRVVRSLRG